MADLTQAQIDELIQLRITTDTPLEDFAERYGVPVSVIKQHTADIKKEVLGAPAEPDQEPDESDVEDVTEKTEKQLHKQMLEALKEAGIGPTEIVGGLKKMLNSGDMQDVRDAVKELNRIMGVYSKEKTASTSGGSRVSETKYDLRIPKRSRED